MDISKIIPLLVGISGNVHIYSYMHVYTAGEGACSSECDSFEVVFFSLPLWDFLRGIKVKKSCYDWLWLVNIDLLGLMGYYTDMK